MQTFTDDTPKSQAPDKYRQPRPPKDLRQAKTSAKAEPPWHKDAQKSKKAKQKQAKEKKAQSRKSRRAANEGNDLVIALVDLLQA